MDRQIDPWSDVTCLVRLPCSLLELKYLNISPLCSKLFSSPLPSVGAPVSGGWYAGNRVVPVPPWERFLCGPAAVETRWAEKKKRRGALCLRTAPWRKVADRSPEPCGSCWASCTPSSPSPSSDYTPLWWVFHRFLTLVSHRSVAVIIARILLRTCSLVVSLSRPDTCHFVSWRLARQTSFRSPTI